MRFPDLLQDVQRLHEITAILGVDLQALQREIHSLKRALASAYPPASQVFRTPAGDLSVSRETHGEEVNDGD